ncbi:MAG: hypothetical protein A2622_07835 [Bdellovibrionales bacterium RIFCSPHIGHO2_01_FULL_40_29]|nr:MAG: hypothetical protein A2622_07835 [Bdellovibrionales bacterium RIFCSPHIGHO2_01_FULL_40_29]OFZ33716.1 MAG: hypothetical protein A3D17_09925 [Bdellovibrionales bacterium RIFCSPHIGHO2_02_FULL_40_15]
MSYQVKVEKIIGRSTSDVFHALKQGRLFMNCGSDASSMKIDFRVGGKYHINFRNHNVSNFGEFLEIIPDRKIVFSWCQSFGDDQKPDSQVTIELFEDGSKTRLVLVHSGFKTKEIADIHQTGWNGIVPDFGSEVQEGRLRMVRKFETSVEKLFDVCRNPDHFNGEFLEIIPNKRMVFKKFSEGSTVALTCTQKDDGTSSLELVQEGLVITEDQKSHRLGWEVVFQKISEVLSVAH